MGVCAYIVCGVCVCLYVGCMQYMCVCVSIYVICVCASMCTSIGCDVCELPVSLCVAVSVFIYYPTEVRRGKF